MTTNQPGSTARQDPRNVSNVIRYRFNWNDPGIQAGVQVGVLPQNAFITMNMIEIVTIFNSGTLNDITVGTVGAAFNNMRVAGDTTAGTLGVYQPALAANKFGRGLTQAGDTAVFLKYAPTGTLPTTGIGEFVLEFEGGFPG